MTDNADSIDESIDTVLRSDHAAIRRGLADLRVNADPSEVGELFEQLCADIVRHFVAEEQYLLPAVRDHLPDGHALSDASFAEHERIEHLLRHLDHDDTTVDRIEAAMSDVEHAIDAHINAQEASVLPAVVRAVDADHLAELGRGVLGAEQLAPTHPRSFVPKNETVSKVTSWLTGLVEKSLDSRDHD